MKTPSTSNLRACDCCGLIQTVPAIPPGMKATCTRCGSSLGDRTRLRSNSATAAIAVAALILYPFAITMPMLKVQQFGHHTESSILGGITSLFADGQILVGLIVLLCSVVFPVTKLLSLAALTIGGLGMQQRHKAFTYNVIQWTGRWGMMDVLLVAILVAALKLGNMMEVTPGPAALAFATCVVLSLIAAATFDPQSLWEPETSTAAGPT